MPKIVNAYAGQESIADSLKSLGESMFGRQAQQELIRQNAYAKSRENENIPLLADALVRGDYIGATRHGVLSNRDSKNVAGYGQYYGVNKYGPASEQGTRATMAVPGANYAHTVAGERENIAQRAAAAHEATERTATTQRAITDRQIQQQQWADEHTLVNLATPDRKSVIPVRKSDVAAKVAEGYVVMPTLDQQKARIVEGIASGQTSLRDAGPDERHIVGANTATTHYVHPTTGETGVSSNSGQTIVLPNGRELIAKGSGFIESPMKDALIEARSGVNTVPPPMPVPNAAGSQAAADAYTAAGLDATGQKHVNAFIGAVPVLRDAAAAAGMPEIGPGYERARQELNTRENASRMVLLEGIGGKPSNYSLQLVQELFPQQGGITNPTSEARRVETIVKHLVTKYNDTQREANNPAILPADRAKLLVHMRQIQHVIGLWTAPAQAAQPTQGAVPPAPQRQKGQTYQTPKGPLVWTGTGWLPAQ